MALTPWFSGMTPLPYDARALRTFEAAKASRIAIDRLVELGIGYEKAHTTFSPFAREIVDQGWRDPSTAPLDGYEFVYWTGYRAHIGSLGGNILRDMKMIGWVPLQ